jgi:hypothetical protein
LPNSKVAILEVPFVALEDINYLIIDGKDLKNIGLGTASILPGKHEIEWSFQEPRGNFAYRGHGILNARAERKYHIHTGYETYGAPRDPLRRWYEPVIFRVKSYGTLITGGEEGDWEDLWNPP